MKRTCILSLLLCGVSLLAGCAAEPALGRTEPLTPGVPELVQGSNETWSPEQTQGFEGGPDYGIPGIRHTVPDTEFMQETITVIPPASGETDSPVPVPTVVLPTELLPKESSAEGAGTEPPPLDSDLEPLPADSFSPEPTLTEPTLTDPKLTDPTVEPSAEPPSSSAEYPDPQEPSEWPNDSQEDLPDPPATSGTDQNPGEPAAGSLETALASRLSGLEGKWSVYAKNLDTGEKVSIGDEPMVAASLIKLFVAGAYYETDPTLEDGEHCALVDVMLNVSSNDACNRLINYLTKDRINEFIKRQGFTASVLNRRMLEQSDEENYTSAKECGVVLEAIMNGAYINPAVSARLLQNLKDQERTGKIPAGVPAGVPTANKTGELSDTENDACIVWSEGGTYILCVMSTELPNVYAARQEIVSISALVYRYFTTGELPAAESAG